MYLTENREEESDGTRERERESQVRVRNWSIIEALSRLGNRATISRDQEAWKSVEIGIGIGRTGGHRFPSPEKHG